MTFQKPSTKMKMLFIAGFAALFTISLMAVLAAILMPARVSTGKKVQREMCERTAAEYNTLQIGSFTAEDFTLSYFNKESGTTHIAFADSARRPVHHTYNGCTAYYTGAELQYDSETGSITLCDCTFMIVD